LHRRFVLRRSLIGIAWGAIAIIALSSPAHGNSELLSLKRELEDAYVQYQQFSDQGDLPNAERLGTLALELGEQIYGMDHPNTAVLSFNLAKTLNASTRFRWRGLRVAELAVARYRSVFGENADDTVVPMTLLIQVLAKGLQSNVFGDEQTNPKYRGEIKNGKPEGFGILIWFDGKKYVGMWKNGKMNGQGTRTLGHFWDRPDIKPFQTEKGIFKDDKSWNTTIVDKKHKIFGKFVNGKWIRP
jgi:hypothetical protein